MTANVPRALGGLHVADLVNNDWHKDPDAETGLIGMGHCGDDVSEKVIFVAMSKNNVFPSERRTLCTMLRASGAQGNTGNPAYTDIVFRLDGSSSLGMVLDGKEFIPSIFGRHLGLYFSGSHDTVNNYLMFSVDDM